MIKDMNYISSFVIACIALGYILVSGRVVFAEPPKPTLSFLELEAMYRGDKDYKHLPFVPEDPHKRLKNGPTLKNVTHKANKEWLKKWISNPGEMIPNARMPRLMLSDDEIEAVLAYLTSIGDKELPKQEWEPYLLKMKMTWPMMNTKTWRNWYRAARQSGDVRGVIYVIRLRARAAL